MINMSPSERTVPMVRCLLVSILLPILLTNLHHHHHHHAHAFNLDTLTAYVERGTPGSDFGFDVSLYKDRNVSW